MRLFSTTSSPAEDVNRAVLGVDEALAEIPRAVLGLLTGVHMGYPESKAGQYHAQDVTPLPHEVRFSNVHQPG
jgi:hypothetical protein